MKLISKENLEAMRRQMHYQHAVKDSPQVKVNGDINSALRLLRKLSMQIHRFNKRRKDNPGLGDRRKAKALGSAHRKARAAYGARNR